MGKNQTLFTFVSSTLKIVLVEEKGYFKNVRTVGELMNSMYHMEVSRGLLNSSS